MKYRFTGDKGIGHGVKPISTRFPPSVDAVLRSLPNRNDYIREAVHKYQPSSIEKPKAVGRLGIKRDEKPITTKFPADLYAFLQALPKKSEYIREAVIHKLRKDGLIS